MNKNGVLRFVIVFALANTVSGWLCADQKEDEEAIRKSTALYVEAFNKQDARAIADLWSTDAVYSNPETGDEVVGRKAIEDELAAIFGESKDVRLEVTITAIRFVSPNVAIEEGTATVTRPDADPDVTAYSAVHIRNGGNWLLDRMTEQAIPEFFSNYGHLKDLEWMLGTWVDQDEQATIETTCQWTKNQNFLYRAFAVTVKDQIDLSGVQFIGWDPVAKKIRSWVFDSDGGFGNATWTKKDNRWIIDSAGTLPDGRRSSAINIMTIIDESTITWESTGRELDGEILPNIDPVKITRNAEKE
jgi:uncharacterized protein (TIGR02246 family)